MFLAPQRLLILQELLDVDRELQHNEVAIAQLRAQRRRRRERKRRACWVRPWLLRRMQYGQYHQLMRELEMEDVPAFRNFLRMDPAMFQELLLRVGPRIEKQDTFYRSSLEPGLKLAITLRHLATGNTYKSLMYSFRVAHNTICIMVPEVCAAIVAEYADEVFSIPTTPEEWQPIADLFRDRWNFPHALGALDGKHVSIRCPKNSGSLYYNYKGFYSIVLMALVDADYRFIWIDVGAQGSASDAQVFNATELKDAIESEEIGFPQPDPLPNDDPDSKTPYFIIGDDAFALRTWMMKPFSRRNLSVEERIFNYRLSRARRIVENAFGILGNRFQCLLGSLRQESQTVEEIVMSCCTLHNIMRIRYPAAQNAVLDQYDQNQQLVPGAWRDEVNMQDMNQVLGGNASAEAKRQRLLLKHYVNSPQGAVPWQDRMI